MQPASEIADGLALVGQQGAPGVVLPGLGHVAAEDVAGVDEGVVGEGAAPVFFEEFLGREKRPGRSDMGVVQRLAVEIPMQAIHAVSSMPARISRVIVRSISSFLLCSRTLYGEFAQELLDFAQHQDLSGQGRFGIGGTFREQGLPGRGPVVGYGQPGLAVLKPPDKSVG